MKKRMKKLSLHRETLRHLTASSLTGAAGGTGSGNTCDSVNQYGGSYTYCDEKFCASGGACDGTQAFSWCICTE